MACTAAPPPGGSSEPAKTDELGIYRLKRVEEKQ